MIDLLRVAATAGDPPSPVWLAPIVALVCVCLTAVFALVAWIVRTLLKTATTNAQASEQLKGLGERMERVERALFAPAWEQQRAQSRAEWSQEERGRSND